MSSETAGSYPVIEISPTRRSSSSQEGKQQLQQQQQYSYYKCAVKFIDDNDNADFTFEKEEAGSKLLQDVCNKLNIIEMDYFGLRFVDRNGQRHWLNPVKQITKQLSQCVAPYLLCFRVKYYPSDLSIVHEDITRYQLFLQVKRDLEHGRLLSTRSEAALLCAYVLQATLGPYDEQDLLPGYSKEMKLAAAFKDHEFHDTVEQYHRDKMTDVSTSDAERSFLLFTATMQTYGVDPYPCKSDQGTPLHFSFTWKGLCLFESNKLARLFPWSNVVRMTIDGKFLKVVAKERGTVKPYKTLFDFGSETNAKHVWSSAVEHMVFFTQEAGKTPKKIRSSRSLFKKGSSLKFSGRTADQLRSTSLGRNAPKFERTPSMRERSRVVERSLDRSAATSRRSFLLLSPNPSVDMSNGNHHLNTITTLNDMSNYDSDTTSRHSSVILGGKDRGGGGERGRGGGGGEGGAVGGERGMGGGGGGGGAVGGDRGMGGGGGGGGVVNQNGTGVHLDYMTSSATLPRQSTRNQSEWRGGELYPNGSLSGVGGSVGASGDSFESKEEGKGEGDEEWRRHSSAMYMNGHGVSVDSGYSTSSSKATPSADDQMTPTLNGSNRSKDEWTRAQLLTNQLRSNLAAPSRPDSITDQPMFNTRDSTLDITQSFQQNLSHSPEKFGRTISRDTLQTRSSNRSSTRTSTASSEDELPSVGELRRSIQKFTGDQLSEPEVVVSTRRSASELMQAPRAKLLEAEDSRKSPKLLKSSSGRLKNSSGNTVYDTLITQSKQESTEASSPKTSYRVSVKSDDVKKRRHVVESSITATSVGKVEAKIDDIFPLDDEIIGKNFEAFDEGSPKNEVNEWSFKSLFYEAYFILGVVCGILFLTVLIAETDEPKVLSENREPTTEAEQAIVATNSFASYVRQTYLFSAFYDGFYAPFRAFLVHYLSWMFQT